MNEKVTDEEAMREVMGLLDEWQAPEPSVWFDGRMMARFREEQERAPEGWFARLRDRFVYGNAVSMKPMLAGAMALVLVAGGGGYLQLQHAQQRTQPAATSATVQDLQILDNNDQAIQQMDQLLDGDDGNDNS